PEWPGLARGPAQGRFHFHQRGRAGAGLRCRRRRSPGHVLSSRSQTAAGGTGAEDRVVTRDAAGRLEPGSSRPVTAAVWTARKWLEFRTPLLVDDHDPNGNREIARH